MIISVRILSAVLVSLTLGGTAKAAPAAQPARNDTMRVDCQKLGSEVSALIDKRTDSPNIVTARSMFQVGIMECMEGSDDSANKHYRDVKKLLGETSPTESIRVPNAGR